MPAGAGGASGGEGSEAPAGGEIPIGGTSSEAALTTFCEALEVVKAKCQRCHDQPPANGAPVPFLVYEDFKAPYGSSGTTYAEVAMRAVELDIMPYVVLNEPPTSLMPPVEPLTTEEKTTLLTWLRAGALPEGGTDCP